MYELLDQKSDYVTSNGHYSPNEALELVNVWEAHYVGVPRIITAFRTVYRVLEIQLRDYAMLEEKNEKLQKELDELKKEKDAREAKAAARRSKSTGKS